jgi:hypothetical protein
LPDEPLSGGAAADYARHGLAFRLAVAAWTAGCMVENLYWVTETVTQPWGIITHTCFAAGFCGVCVFVCARR